VQSVQSVTRNLAAGSVEFFHAICLVFTAVFHLTESDGLLGFRSALVAGENHRTEHGMGRWVMGHGSNGSRKSDGSHGSCLGDKCVAPDLYDLLTLMSPASKH